jgi:hypothetical protein
MTWSVRWHLLAERDFYELPHWKTARSRDIHVWRIVRYA